MDALSLPSNLHSKSNPVVAHVHKSAQVWTGYGNSVLVGVLPPCLLWWASGSKSYKQESLRPTHTVSRNRQGTGHRAGIMRESGPSTQECPRTSLTYFKLKCMTKQQHIEIITAFWEKNKAWRWITHRAPVFYTKLKAGRGGKGSNGRLRKAALKEVPWISFHLCLSSYSASKLPIFRNFSTIWQALCDICCNHLVVFLI